MGTCGLDIVYFWGLAWEMTLKADGSVRVIGLIGGVAVSTFSKTLALLFGMLVFGVQVSDIGIFIC